MGPIYVTRKLSMPAGGSLVVTSRCISLRCNGIWEMQMTWYCLLLFSLLTVISSLNRNGLPFPSGYINHLLPKCIFVEVGLVLCHLRLFCIKCLHIYFHHAQKECYLCI